MIARRSLLFGLGSAFAAPAIVRAASIMPVKAIEQIEPFPWGFSPAMQALADLEASSVG